MASSTSDTGSSSGQGGPRFALLAQVRAYWQGLRQGTALPTRDKIDPRGIAEALESTFLLERIAPGVARFRIAGLHLHDLIGLDVRGMPLSTLFDPASRKRLSDGVEAVFNSPAILEMWLEAERGLGRPHLEGRMLLLPLRDAQGQTSLALGCLAMIQGVSNASTRTCAGSEVQKDSFFSNWPEKNIRPTGLQRPQPWSSCLFCHPLPRL